LSTAITGLGERCELPQQDPSGVPTAKDLVHMTVNFINKLVASNEHPFSLATESLQICMLFIEKMEYFDEVATVKYFKNYFSKTAEMSIVDLV
jgi:hypothetical protein